MLDDLTSGFNITSNITRDSLLNEMLGYTQSEVNQLIEQVTGFNYLDRQR